jgi:molybdopterin synthase sulfur carrier subunit
VTSGVNVRVPTILRSYTGGAPVVAVAVTAAVTPHVTVAAVIDSLEAAYPGIKARLVDDDGRLRRFVNVYVGDEDVRFADGLSTTVPLGAELSVIPAVAGG